MEMYNSILKNKRIMLIGTIGVIALFCAILNVTFSAFTSSTNKRAANIIVGNLNYKTIIDGEETYVIEAQANKISKNNVILISENSIDTKYELTYEVCSDETCTSTINKPEGFEVEYSSKTLNKVTDIIGKQNSKLIRLVITNNTSNDYYIKLGVNAGFSHNALVLEKKIDSEYSEEDLRIISYINGVKSNNFPIDEDYTPIVECNNGASGKAIWNENEWIFNISNLTLSETICEIDFAKNPANWLEADNTTLLGLIKENNELKHTLTKPGQDVNLATESLLSYTPDDYTSDYGNSYYFRGNVINNYVVFANKCWKIVRVTGDGNIKLILQNNKAASCNITSNLNNFIVLNDESSTSTHQFNSATGVYSSATGIGFMYGDKNATSYQGVQSNLYTSRILNSLKSWYSIVFINENIINQISDVVWCNDKSLNSGRGWGTTYSTFGAYKRLNSSKSANPSLVCPTSDNINGNLGNLSKFTANDAINGNALLYTIVEEETKYYKIGTLTADEIAFAGGIYNTANNNYYLYNRYEWWTLSPRTFDSNNTRAYIWLMNSNGSLYFKSAYSELYIRPSIALNYDVQATYNISSEYAPGTVNNPYVISV